MVSTPVSTRKRGRPRLSEQNESSPAPGKTPQSSIKRRKLNTDGSASKSTEALSPIKKLAGLLFGHSNENDNVVTDQLEEEEEGDIYNMPMTDDEEAEDVGEGSKSSAGRRRPALKLIPTPTAKAETSTTSLRRSGGRVRKSDALKKAKAISKEAARKRLSNKNDIGESESDNADEVKTPTKRKSNNAKRDVMDELGGDAEDVPQPGKSNHVKGKKVLHATGLDSTKGTTKGILTPSKKRGGRPRKSVAFEEPDEGLDEIDLGFKDVPSSGKKASIPTSNMTSKSRSPKSIPKPEMEREVDSDDSDIACSVCSGLISEEPNEILLCEKCDFSVHQDCYGVPEVPENEWFCRDCQPEAEEENYLQPALQNDAPISEMTVELPDIEGFARHLRCMQRLLLDRLAGQKHIKLRGHDEEMQKRDWQDDCKKFNIRITFLADFAKLVESVISEISVDHQEKFHVVRLNGFIHTDDKLASREIWRQLGRDMDIEDDGKPNYADTLASLLALLSHPSEISDAKAGQTAKSVIFVLDEFDLFASHPRQTLLYNLFDIAQARKAPIAVLGLTTRIDVVESLEKRVKSRFSHRYVYLSLPKSLPAFWDACREGLMVDKEEFNGDVAGQDDFLLFWHSMIEDLYKKDITFKHHIQSHFYQSKSVPAFFTSCILPIASLSTKNFPLTGLLFSAVSVFLSAPDSKLHILQGLSDLELALLIAAARLDIILDTDTCNFAMAYDEYSTLTSRHKIQTSSTGVTALGGSAKIWGGDVALGAWERLAEYELLVPTTIETVTHVSGYGNQVARVFHNYGLIAEKVPRGFEGAINILDATVTTLNQVLSLLNDEVKDSGKRLFSEECLEYVQLLTKECAISLSKVEPAILEACLDRKERRLRKKSLKGGKEESKELDLMGLKIDEKTFLEKVESANWNVAADAIEESMERLYDLQLHLLLVFQVITVGVLSKDVSCGKVDIKSIVTYHERINRTAKLVGIAPKAKRTSRYAPNFSSSESDVSSESDSDITSDCKDSVKSSKSKKSRRVVPLPPSFIPPPAPTPPRCVPSPRVVIDLTEENTTLPNINPPSYSDSHKPPVSNLGSASSTIGASTVSTPPPKLSPSPVFLDEKIRDAKEKHKEKPEERTVEVKDEPKLTIPEARLFNTNHNTFGFKLKTLFRSKESLAAEMKEALSNAESSLTAWIIQDHSLRLVPHSAFHGLESTHMRTILTQLKDDSWYKTFSVLRDEEHATLHRALRPWINGKCHQREIIVLKVLQENKLNAWMRLITSLVKEYEVALPQHENGRIVLAILKEQLIGGKPITDQIPHVQPPKTIPVPPPGDIRPPPPRCAPPAPLGLRPPPLPPAPRPNPISDLNQPPARAVPYPPPTNITSVPGGGIRGPGAEFAAPGPNIPPRPAPQPSIHISDTTSIIERDAALALTTFAEYTIRPSPELPWPPLPPGIPKFWTRCSIMLESTEKRTLQQRLQFYCSRANVIDMKLRLTLEQANQVTRLMDEIKSREQDGRFEWCWVEISLFDDKGVEMREAIRAAEASVIHVVAKRECRSGFRAIEVYNAMMRARPQPPAQQMPQPLPMPTIVNMPPKMRGKNDSDSDYGSESDSSGWSGDESVGRVRRRLRIYKDRRRWGSEDEADERIKLDLGLKRGDDVVKALVELWTADEGRGRGENVVR
ncbi:hypothetical protein B7494_g1416 [Chlorociboria aeruginascens]|nr:hypothetical protein B7494_g1416 [Chlorociboria aeruginascens]